MSWTMPHRTLQIVAFLLIAASAGSFALGLAGNMSRGGRLPGAQILGGVAGAPTVDAQEATPLSDERIEGPPPPSPTARGRSRFEVLTASTASGGSRRSGTPR